MRLNSFINTLFLMLLVISLAVLTVFTHKAGSPEDKNLYKRDLKEITVPFTYLNTENHDIELLFSYEDASTDVLLNNQKLIEFPRKGAVVKTIEVDNDLLLLHQEFFSGRFSFFLVSKSGSILSDNRFPDSLNDHLLKSVFASENKVYVMLYNPVSCKNYLYKFSREKDLLIHYPEFVVEIPFGTKDVIDTNFMIERENSSVFICGDHDCYRFQFQEEKLEHIYSDNKTFLLDIKFIGHDLWGLCLNESEAEESFILKNLNTGENQPVEAEGVPYKLTEKDGRPYFYNANNAESLLKMFLLDMSKMNRSGLMDLGVNNYEGRIAWSQVDYLNGFIDVLSNNQNKIDDFSLFSSIKDALKTRLDIEMYMLDRLMDKENAGMISKRYSINREPEKYIVHSARLLYTFKRYKNEVENAVPITNYERLLKEVTTLDGHIDQLKIMDEKNTSLDKVAYYMFFRRGSPTKYDGSNLPYNQTHAWVSAILYGEANEYSSVNQQARSMVELFLINENFYEKFPPNCEWHYTWGLGYDGWTKSAGISVNTPDYKGNKNNANISYRSMDATAILQTVKLYPETIDEKIIDYFVEAVEMNGLRPYITTLLQTYGRKPKPPLQISNRYIRARAPHMLQDSFWAYSFLLNNPNYEVN